MSSQLYFYLVILIGSLLGLIIDLAIDRAKLIEKEIVIRLSRLFL